MSPPFDAVEGLLFEFAPHFCFLVLAVRERFGQRDAYGRNGSLPMGGMDHFLREEWIISLRLIPSSFSCCRVRSE